MIEDKIDIPPYNILWLSIPAYNRYQLQSVDLRGVFGDLKPLEQLAVQRYDGLKYDYLLVTNDLDEPQAVLALQWYNITPYSVTPLMHYHILDGCARWCLRHCNNALKDIAQYYGLKCIIGDVDAQTKDGSRFNAIMKKRLDGPVKWVTREDLKTNNITMEV